MALPVIFRKKKIGSLSSLIANCHEHHFSTRKIPHFFTTDADTGLQFIRKYFYLYSVYL
jgi:hypothetical protein